MPIALLPLVLALLQEALSLATDPAFRADLQRTISSIMKAIRGEELTDQERADARAALDRSEARLQAAQPKP